MERSRRDLDAGILPGSGGSGFQESPVSPRIAVGTARALYLGPGLDLSPHMNVATTIAVSLSHPFELRTWTKRAGWSAWHSEHVGVIPSETLHHLKSRGPMAFLYLDPLADPRNAPSGDALVRGRERLRHALRPIGIDEAFAAFGLVGRRPPDARIARVVLEIERRPDAFGRLRDAADLALPFRRYRLWRRMAVVMRALTTGANLTEAALSAGFSSSAHLSTSFRRMFGVSPSEVLALGAVIDVAAEPPAARMCDRQPVRDASDR
jgi:AraC-like DNA-binding protein